jgi:altronate dehydratase
VALVQELIEEISTARRTVRPASDLVLGLQCGGSDGWSGVTANPALGAATDLLVAAGYGLPVRNAGNLWSGASPAGRAADPAVAAALEERIGWWEAHALRHGISLDNNPSPGNKAGG